MRWEGLGLLTIILSAVVIAGVSLARFVDEAGWTRQPAPRATAEVISPAPVLDGTCESCVQMRVAEMSRNYLRATMGRPQPGQCFIYSDVLPKLEVVTCVDLDGNEYREARFVP